MAESICVGCATKGAEIEQLRAELAALKADSASLEAPEQAMARRCWTSVRDSWAHTEQTASGEASSA